ncbi:MAG: disulfide oxidoreductase [bacterium]|nr:disulfide oxidoreductase [bacterium]
MRKLVTWIKTHVLYIAWGQALVATLGSLYFSEIRKFTPCVLCWYQRIGMYPLVAILAIGIIHKDKRVYRYVLPLSLIGWVIALYHNLIYYHIVNEALIPCTSGVSCTTRFNVWWGWLSIPLLSLIAYTVINVCMLIYYRTRIKK